VVQMHSGMYVRCVRVRGVDRTTCIVSVCIEFGGN